MKVRILNFEFLIFYYGSFFCRRPKKQFLDPGSKTRNPKLDQRGFTLIEMLVVLAILAILAAVTVPYAEVTVKRNKELELKRDLREMRSAIDRFHDDWQANRFSKFGEGFSDDGYPKSLDSLVEGVESSDPAAPKLKYLRRVPENPFGDTDLEPSRQWGLRDYEDDPKASEWGGKDVYDVYCQGDAKALDGSYYHDW